MKFFRLTILIYFLALLNVMAQNPHGDSFNADCKSCHTSDSWDVDFRETGFQHDTTGFVLDGQHSETSCISCHQTLVFNEVGNECVSCHADVHGMTVGNDCMRCHSTATWLVDIIPELHEQNGFPLFGAHDLISCVECHTGQTSLQWTRIGNECSDCHMADFQATTEPNHVESGFSTDCIECHLPTNDIWSPEGGEFHSYFPLTQGHDIADCNECHTNETFVGLSSECVDCHLSDYENTQNPNHTSAGFSTNCVDCHTTEVGWKSSLGGGGEFHNFFPLTLGHDIQSCAECHNTNDYTDISSDCYSCHQADYLSTESPNHKQADISTDCKTCHTTNPGWTPADFPASQHSFFPLTGVHNISTCTECHVTDSYSDASSECISCHRDDYEQTTNPNHQSAGFNTECTSCHGTTSGWTPAKFTDHDSQFFPIYSGKHRGEWNSCYECHVNETYSSFSCLECHEHRQSKMDDEHRGIRNYVYESSACLNCHPDGRD